MLGHFLRMNLIVNKPTLKNPKLARLIIDQPHRLGHYLGYTKLTPLHSEWIKYMWNAKQHVSLQAHRNSYKTSSIIIIGSILKLTFFWNNRIAIIRKDFTSASEVLKVITRIIKSDKYKALTNEIFGMSPELIVDSAQKMQWSWKTQESPEGNVNAFGIGGSITGTHFDDIFCDDIITLKDRISKAERKAVDEFVREIIANVIDPDKFVKFSGTPWHKMDTWRLLPKPLVYDIYSTGLKVFTPERIQEIKKYTTASLFAANYELRHVASEDTIFDNPSWQSGWDLTLATQGHIDAKYQGGHTGAFTMMARKPDGRVQAVGFIFHKHINEEYDRLIKKWGQYRCGTVHMELNADKGYAARDLSGLGMITSTYDEKENKHVKIIQNLKTYWDRIDWSEDTDPEYMSQILDYIEGQEPDDCADSAASCIRRSGIFNGSVVVKAIADDYTDQYME